jgi:predicted neuraminidase
MYRSRKADWVYYQWSVDDGKSWSRTYPSSLPNSNSGLQAVLLASGALAVVFNNARGGGGRWPLSVALSEDYGVTWPWVRDLETRDSSIQEGKMPPEYR